MPQRVYILHGKRFKQKPEIRNFSGVGGKKFATKQRNLYVIQMKRLNWKWNIFPFK